MPRAPYLPNSNFPFHVSARCINKEWFRIPLNLVWDIFSEQLFFIHHAFNVKIHSFVLMSNHYHLILSTPDANLSEAMCWLNRQVGIYISKEANRINQTFGSRYYRTLISDYKYYLHAYKYVYRNPCEAKISDRAEDYPFSTLSGLLGQNKLCIPIEEDKILFDDIENTLKWLNTKPKKQDWFDVGNALRKKQFKLRRQGAKPHTLEYEYF